MYWLVPVLTVTTASHCSRMVSQCYRWDTSRDWSHMARIVTLQGCWSQGDGCGEECIVRSLSQEESLASLKFCCCRGPLCNRDWREGEDVEKREASEERSELERLELSVSGLDHFILLITALSLCLTIVLLTVFRRILLNKRSQKERSLDSRRSEVCLIREQ